MGRQSPLHKKQGLMCTALWQCATSSSIRVKSGGFLWCGAFFFDFPSCARREWAFASRQSPLHKKQGLMSAALRQWATSSCMLKSEGFIWCGAFFYLIFHQALRDENQ